MRRKSIVVELQRDALDRGVPLTDLLRKALLVARKLGLDEFDRWILQELEGYPDPEVVPDYRMAAGEVVARDPWQGWIPVVFKYAEKANVMSRMPFIQPIAELEDFYRSGEANSPLLMSYAPDVAARFMDSVGRKTPPALEVQRAVLFRVLDTVRTTVLNWALRLEKDGILGEGMSFSSTEKEAAEKMSYNVNNFFGHVTQSSIQQGTEQSSQSTSFTHESVSALEAFAGCLGDAVTKLSLSAEHEKELVAELATLKAQLASPKPKKSIIVETLQSIRSILQNAAGSAAGQLLIQIGSLLA